MRLRRDETLSRLQAMFPVIESRFDVRDLAIFGSVARDEATDQRDLDLLVEFPSTATFMSFMGLREFLEDAFGVPVDLVTRDALRERLRHSIDSKAVHVA